MLAIAEQLGAGLGASGVKGAGEKLKSGPKGDGVGNAHLRLWIGERSLGECFKFSGGYSSFINLKCFLYRAETKSWPGERSFSTINYQRTIQRGCGSNKEEKVFRGGLGSLCRGRVDV